MASKNSGERKYTYTRAHHARSIYTTIRELQGKETNSIPQEIIDLVGASLCTTVNPMSVRKVLRDLDQRIYLGQVNEIAGKLGWTNPFRQLNLDQDFMVRAFDIVTTTFDQHGPQDRKNFWPHNFVMYQLVRLYYDIYPDKVQDQEVITEALETLYLKLPEVFQSVIDPSMTIQKYWDFIESCGELTEDNLHFFQEKFVNEILVEALFLSQMARIHELQKVWALTEKEIRRIG